MNYTYLIDNVNTLNESIGVVYIPDDDTLLSHFKKISSEGLNDSQIHQSIIEHAPIELWDLEIQKKSATKKLNSLVGGKFNSDSAKTINERDKKVKSVPISILLSNLKQQINNEVSILTNAYKNEYSPDEIDKWDELKEQSLSVINENSSYDPAKVSFLQALATAKEISLIDMANKVIRKNREFEEFRESVIIEVKMKEVAIDKLLNEYNTKIITYDEAIEQMQQIPFIQLDKDQ